MRPCLILWPINDSVRAPTTHLEGLIVRRAWVILFSTPLTAATCFLHVGVNDDVVHVVVRILQFLQ